MTSSPLSIIQTFHSLEKEGSPLNFNYIRRVHPDLFDSIYTAFPSFYSAQKAAGIDPCNIKREYQPTVQCQICGKHLSILCSHLWQHHQVKIDEYKTDYKVESLESEEVKLKRTRTIDRTLHWEWIWSKAYLKDFILEIQHRGEELTYSNLSKKYPNLINIIERDYSCRLDTFFTENNIKSSYRGFTRLNLDAMKKMFEAMIQEHGYIRSSYISAGYGKFINLKIRRYPGKLEGMLKDLNIDTRYIYKAPTWDETSIKIKLRELIEENKKVPSSHWMSRKHSGLYTASRKYFDSWQSAVKAAMGN